MGIHIGKLIKTRLEQLGINKSEFARRMGRTPQAIQWWLQKETIDTGLLEKISEELHFNFFRFYVDDISATSFKKMDVTMMEDVNFDYDNKKVQKLSEKLKECEKERKYLKEINELLREQTGGK